MQNTLFHINEKACFYGSDKSVCPLCFRFPDPEQKPQQSGKDSRAFDNDNLHKRTHLYHFCTGLLLRGGAQRLYI